MNKIKKIIINSSLNSSLSKIWDVEYVHKIQIASIIDSKIDIDFAEEDSKNQIPFIAQREAAWIRLHLKDETYLDLVCDEILVLGSENGILINLLGDCYEYTNDLIVKRITEFAKSKNLKIINTDIEFEYRKHAGINIKKRLKELVLEKSNIFIDRLDYYVNRKKVLREAIELVIQKRYVEKNWDQINKKVSQELEKINV